MIPLLLACAAAPTVEVPAIVLDEPVTETEAEGVTVELDAVDDAEPTDDEPVPAEVVEAVEVESSASTVKGRLGSLLQRDREVLGDSRAETAELPVDLFPPDDATDEVPEEVSPEDVPEPLRARLPGFPTGGFTSGLLSVFKRGDK